MDTCFPLLQLEAPPSESDRIATTSEQRDKKRRRGNEQKGDAVARGASEQARGRDGYPCELEGRRADGILLPSSGG